MLISSFLVVLKLLLVKHLLTNVLSALLKLSVVNQGPCAFHKIFLMLVVTVDDRAVDCPNYLLVPYHHLALVFLEALIKLLVLTFGIKLCLEVFAVLLLHDCLLHSLFRLLSLVVLSLPLDDSTPLIQLTVLIHWVVALVIFLKTLNLILFVF